MVKRWLLLLFFLFPFSLWSQVIIDYFEKENQVDIVQQDIFPVTIKSGLTIFPGDSIHSYNSTLELSFAPSTVDSSRILLGPETHLTIQELFFMGSQTNLFFLSEGKIRVRAMGNRNIIIETSTDTIEITNSDTLIEWRNENLRIIVFSGTVTSVSIIDGTLHRIEEGTEYRDTDNLRIGSILTAADIRRAQKELSFKKDPVDIHPDSRVIQMEPSLEVFPTENEQEIAQEAIQVTQEIGEKERKKNFPLVLNASAGLLINGETPYGLLILKPSFRLNNFELTLSFPIITQGSILESANWYVPLGNDEWSWGNDITTSRLDQILDLINDTLLKIDTLRYSHTDSRNSITLAIGILNDISFSTSPLVQSYANTPLYPSDRKSSLFFNLNLGTVGFEVLAEEVSTRAFYAARFFINSSDENPFQLGLSSVVDFGLSKILPSVDINDQTIDSFNTFKTTYDIGYWGAGLDLLLPLFQLEFSELDILGSLTTFIPISTANSQLSFLFDGLWNSNINSPVGLEASVGLSGRMRPETEFKFDYNLRIGFRGSLTPPTYINKNYDWIRYKIVDNLIKYYEIDTSEQDEDYYKRYAVSFGGGFNLSYKERIGISVKSDLPIYIVEGALNLQDNIGISARIFVSPTPTLMLEAFGSSYDIMALFDNFLSAELDMGVALHINLFHYLKISATGRSMILRNPDGSYQFSINQTGPTIGGFFSFLTTISF